MLRFKGIALVVLFFLPAVVFRVAGIHSSSWISLMIFGAGVVAASFLLAWAAEAAQLDISGGLAIAVLALIAVLPEYAIDLYFAYTAGSDPAYVAYAAANMTGSNRLLMGLGWPLVVLVGLMVAKRQGNPIKALVLEPGTRVELGFLLIAGVIAFIAPITGTISLFLGFVMLSWFIYYLVRMSRQGVEEPTLIGTAAVIGDFPQRTRRIAVVVMFLSAALVIVFCAQPFAESLLDTGKDLGIDEFLLVQWLAPLASEAPEFIVAIFFATRGNAQDAIGTLISSKINQWTLLIGSIPIAYAIGGGGLGGIVLDGRQFEEILLSATQTLMGVAILLALRFPRWGAWALLGLFAVQFAIVDTTGRLILCGLYSIVAIVAMLIHRREILPTLAAPFRPPLEASAR